MRTTLTLDNDVANLLRQEMVRSGASLKAAVNHFLRVGLMYSGKRQRKSFAVKPRKLRLPPGLTYDNVSDLLENLEKGRR